MGHVVFVRLFQKKLNLINFFPHLCHVRHVRHVRQAVLAQKAHAQRGKS